MTAPGQAGLAPPAAPTAAAGRANLVLAVACLCQLMVVLDISVVNVALPSVRADLGFSADGLQWVVNAYTLTFGGLLLLGGRVADLFGHRLAALAGLGLFGVTSLLGGLARTPGELVGARALQGVAGALLLPVSLTLITVSFPDGPARHRALATWAAVAGVGGALGVFLGGLLTQELDWRWVLFINVPIATVGAVLAFRSVTSPAGRGGPRMDLAGALLVTVGLFSLVYAVAGTGRHPWGSSQTLAPLAVAVVFLAGFVAYEQRVAAAPLVRFGLLRNRDLAGANIVILFISSAQLGAFYLASLYLQGVLGYSPLRTGLAFVPFSVAVIAGTFAARKLVPARGPRLPLTAGLVIAAGGLGWFARLSPHGSFIGQVLGPSLITGAGLGLCFVAVASAATGGVGPHEAGLASGLLNSCRQCGGSIGLAVLATIANARTGSRTAGTDHAFLVAAFLLAAGAVIASLLLRRPGNRGAPALSATPGPLTTLTARPRAADPAHELPKK
jgi:EmrB/QacA subfamily drug resistance transporter